MDWIPKPLALINGVGKTISTPLYLLDWLPFVPSVDFSLRFCPNETCTRSGVCLHTSVAIFIIIPSAALASSMYDVCEGLDSLCTTPPSS